MGFFAKRTFTGYKEVPGGYSDPEAEYYIESKAEYDLNMKKIRDAENAVVRAERDARDEKKRVIDNANAQLHKHQKSVDEEADRKVRAAQQLIEEKDNEIEELKRQLEEAKQEAQTEKNLHRNMMRIMKERANQKRGISPKKEHDGYVVLESRQWTQKYTEDIWDSVIHQSEYEDKRSVAVKNGYLQIEHKEAKVWKSTLQTPYDASLPLTQVRDRIEVDFRNVLYSIGCAKWLTSEYNGLFYDFGKNEDGYDINGMYKWNYKANYKMGLWEVEIYTTKSLRVPDYRRPVSKKIRKEEEKRKKMEREDLDKALGMIYLNED